MKIFLKNLSHLIIGTFLIALLVLCYQCAERSDKLKAVKNWSLNVYEEVASKQNSIWLISDYVRDDDGDVTKEELEDEMSRNSIRWIEKTHALNLYHAIESYKNNTEPFIAIEPTEEESKQLSQRAKIEKAKKKLEINTSEQIDELISLMGGYLPGLNSGHLYALIASENYYQECLAVENRSAEIKWLAQNYTQYKDIIIHPFLERCDLLDSNNEQVELLVYFYVLYLDHYKNNEKVTSEAERVDVFRETLMVMHNDKEWRVELYEPEIIYYTYFD